MTRSTFKSKFPDIDIPLQDLPTFFFKRMHQYKEFTRPENPLAIFTDAAQPEQSLTLVQMEDLCEKLASGLYHKMGVRSGNVVAVVLPNTIYYLVITMSVLLLGATCTVANPAYTETELAHQLEHSGARFVITDTNTLGTVSGALKHVGRVTLKSHVLCLDDIANCGDKAGNLGTHLFSSLILSSKPYPRVRLSSRRVLQKTPAFICYSSGTTGLPKGVILSHYNIVSNILQGGYVQNMMKPNGKLNRKTLLVLPMFHSFGLVLVAHSLPAICKSSMIIMSKFDMQEFLKHIQTFKITDTLLVPPIINALVKLEHKSLQNIDISSLRWIISGAAPLSKSTVEALEIRFPGTQVMQGFGLTETGPGLALNTPFDKNPYSSGPLLPNVEAKVVDDQGRSLGPNEIGELCFRGPNIMLGYLDNPQETKLIIDSQGFLKSGDIGYIDDQSFVYVTDRKKELIKFNGFQVAPAELEGIILRHPRVKDCAVVGVFDELRQTELPRAYLVVDSMDEKMDDELVIKDVTRWVNNQVAYYKHLRGGCVVVDAIPKNASGKILRRVLRDTYKPTQNNK